MHYSTFATASISGKAVFIGIKEVVQALFRKVFKNVAKNQKVKMSIYLIINLRIILHEYLTNLIECITVNLY